ncbi:MAG: YezD family protein [Sphingobium sp.]
MNDHRSIDLHHAHAESLRPDIVASIGKVRDILDGLRFGSITLTIHDARVVQIDVTEKTRLNG